ncbi:DUF192 domain-containing protein [Steroidobacter sp. S1-65]|uniref:DUF192 domain-containing protein n=1 Tax=Steroidobacter gossypii TaxID=2805490 RepID=A0ABS1WRC5_9GAMM|nr:DUF192 domain-containing protein [Steroidobacter gossypii]MBM0103520.1 DUF192 domain-containing protein [Steroidobacter gossypii]
MIRHTKYFGALLATAAALLWLAIVGLSTARADDAAVAQLDRHFPRSSLQIATPDARLHKFDVWVADDDARRARGLMFVTKMPDQQGMLFIYPKAQPIAMWMKNTHIPLDMLFVRADGRVARVVENTTPMSTKTIESGEPVLAVIELNGGVAKRNNIRVGAQVIHPVFSTQP